MPAQACRTTSRACRPFRRCRARRSTTSPAAFATSDDEEAARKLVEANLRYVVAIALSYRRYGVRLADLISEGNIGLMIALKKFDPTRGHAIRHVRGALDPGLRARPRDPRVEHRGRRRRAAALEGVLPAPAREGADPRLDERRGRGQRAARRAVRNDDARRSRCSPTGSRRATCRSTPRSSTTARRRCSIRCPEAGLRRRTNTSCMNESTSVYASVREAVETLDPRERFIVEVRMMADRADELSLAEIGRRLGRVARTRPPARGAREAKAPETPRGARRGVLERGVDRVYPVKPIAARASTQVGFALPVIVLVLTVAPPVKV